MPGGALGTLVRHPVHRRVCAPAIGIGLASAVVLRALVELRPQAVGDTLQLSALLLAMATVTAVVDPAGSIADATPTRPSARRAIRSGMALVAVCVGWLLALGGAPASVHPSPGSVTSDLAVLCAVVLGAAALEVRAVPRSIDPLGAATAVAMAWAALWLLQPSWSPFAPTGADRRWLLAIAGAGVVAFSLASSDPARPTWRSLRPGRPPRS